MSSRHPAYPHPTIAEAVCDIHFRLPETKVWKPSFAGELFKHIQDEYPEMEPVVEVDLQFESGPAGTGAKILPQSQKVRFKHRTRSLVLQLSDHSFSISTLPPYQGWEVMRTDALAAWRHAEEVLQPVVIRRLGVRYINQFEKETVQDRPGDWFVANDYIPHVLLCSEPGFLARVHVHLSVDNVLIITSGDTNPEPERKKGTIIFDIDRILDKELSSEQGEFIQALDRLHDDVWSIFSLAKGEKLDRLLNGRL